MLCYDCSGQTVEVEKLKSQPMLLNSVDKNHRQHQVKLCQQDLQQRIADLQTCSQQQVNATI